MVLVKRVYEAPARSDGLRILVDRLWPRGLSKERAKVDLWLKEIAPTDELRHWFHHDADRWLEFQKRYKAEIKANKEAVKKLRAAIDEVTQATLLFAATDEKHNNAVVLAKALHL